MEYLFLIMAGYGLWLLASRYLCDPWFSIEDIADQRREDTNSIEKRPKFSIIIPARNEAHNLPNLLSSLAALDNRDFEVLVVDDRSTDDTPEIAERFKSHLPLRVISGRALARGWSPKQWVCHQGANEAFGHYLLFTDADTMLEASCLTKAAAFMERHRLDMMSALPFHHCLSLFEKISGAFHSILLVPTRPFHRPKKGRLFAIGQFLVISAQAYKEGVNHQEVKEALIEDLPLANLALEKGVTYGVYPRAELFRVRMYTSISQFVAGWRRNFRASFLMTSLHAPFEVTCVITCLLAAGQWGSPWALSFMTLGFVVIGAFQKKIGEFKRWGILLAHASVALFCLITALALWDHILGRGVLWKGRTIPA